MFVVTIVVTTTLAVLVTASAVLKVARHPIVVDTLEQARVPARWYGALAAVEIGGAVGAVVGLNVKPIGLVATSCLSLYFLAAIGTHVRAGDRQYAVKPVMPLALSVGALVLRTATL